MLVLSTRLWCCLYDSLCNNTDIDGYHCGCNKGYDGNSYLDPGCHGMFKMKNLFGLKLLGASLI